MSKATAVDDFCILCPRKYNRSRPSLCQCKHCLNWLCLDCMNEHNDEMKQNQNELSSRKNEVEQLLRTKQEDIINESIQSKAQLSEWLRKYIDHLTAEKARIDTDIEREKKKAQEFVVNIASELETVNPVFDTFMKTGFLQSAYSEKCSETLDNCKQQLMNIQLTKEYDLPSIMPKYTFKFNYSTKVSTNDIPQTSADSENQAQTEEYLTVRSNVVEEEQDETDVSDVESTDTEDDDLSFPDENYFYDREKFDLTSYTVHCLASDEINIMYSTIDDSQHERIAYCYLEKEDVGYGLADPSRLWKQSRIVDMIWWDTIEKFVCATDNGIYAVEYLDSKFRILKVIHGSWTQVRIAANTGHLWIHASGEITIYNVNFQVEAAINVIIPRSLTRTSFCLTDNFVAFAFIRRITNDHNVLHVEFYDRNMKQVKKVRLGLSETSCMIRTDGNDRFYVAMGQQRFYILSSKGDKQIINLGKKANSLAVVNSQSIVLTKLRAKLELVKC